MNCVMKEYLWVFFIEGGGCKVSFFASPDPDIFSWFLRAPVVASGPVFGSNPAPPKHTWVPGIHHVQSPLFLLFLWSDCIPWRRAHWCVNTQTAGVYGSSQIPPCFPLEFEQTLIEVSTAAKCRIFLPESLKLDSKVSFRFEFWVTWERNFFYSKENGRFVLCRVSKIRILLNRKLETVRCEDWAGTQYRE